MIAILLSVVAYFLRRLVSLTDKLNISVGQLEILVKGQETACYEKHKSLGHSITIFEAKFKLIEEKLNKNSNDIAEIKGQLNAE